MSTGSILEEKPVEKNQGWAWGLSGLEKGQLCLEATSHPAWTEEETSGPFEVIEQIWLLDISTQNQT